MFRVLVGVDVIAQRGTAAFRLRVAGIKESRVVQTEAMSLIEGTLALRGASRRQGLQERNDRSAIRDAEGSNLHFPPPVVGIGPIGCQLSPQEH